MWPLGFADDKPEMRQNVMTRSPGQKGEKERGVGKRGKDQDKECTQPGDLFLLIRPHLLRILSYLPVV